MASEKNNGWLVDLSQWRVREIRAWNKSITTDMDATITLMAGAIKSWEYPGDPSAVADYDDLSAAQWATCLQKVGNALRDIFQAAADRLQ